MTPKRFLGGTYKGCFFSQPDCKKNCEYVVNQKAMIEYSGENIWFKKIYMLEKRNKYL